MNRMRVVAAMLLALPLWVGSVSAQEIASPALAKAVESQLGIKPQRIIKTPYLGGLYEIYAGGQLFYSDEKGSVFVFGSLIDYGWLLSFVVISESCWHPATDNKNKEGINPEKSICESGNAKMESNNSNYCNCSRNLDVRALSHLLAGKFSSNEFRNLCSI